MPNQRYEFDLSVVLACYHDAALLPASVAEIVGTLDAAGLSYELIFVDDASRDQTPDVIQKIVDAFESTHHVRFVRHAINQGRGAAVRDGFLAASGAVVGFIDIDLEIAAKYIPSAVARIRDEDVDGIVGRRIINWSWRTTHRYLMSKCYAWLARKVLPLGEITDSEAGFKFFRRDAILPVVHACRDTGWFWDSEITALAIGAGLRLQELPCVYTRRRDKQSSVKPLRDSAEYLLRLATFAFSTRRDPERSRSYWKYRAPDFERAAQAEGGWTQWPVRWFVRHRLERLRNLVRVPPGSRVVELGCGAGDLGEWLAVSGVPTIGVDLSRPLLEMARARFQASLDASCRLIQADVTELPIVDECADCLLAIGVIDYLPPSEVFVQAHRVLKPGGRMVVTVPKLPSPFSLIRRGPGAWLRGRLFDLPPILTAMTRGDLERLLTIHGFAVDSMSSLAQASWIVLAHKKAQNEQQ